MADTIMQGRVERVPMREVLWDALLRAICRRWDHRWRLYGKLPFGRRELCDRCATNRVVFADGDTVEASAVAIRGGDVEFAEALYIARWGDVPRRKMRPGEWPAP